MAEICSIKMDDGNILVNLHISKSEYDLLGNYTRDLLLLPTHMDFLNRQLTTGKLGNSNRIMLPKKILKKFEIVKLEKKIASKTFRVNDEIYLLIKLKKSTIGIPDFGGPEK